MDCLPLAAKVIGQAADCSRLLASHEICFAAAQDGTWQVLVIYEQLSLVFSGNLVLFNGYNPH